MIPSGGVSGAILATVLAVAEPLPDLLPPRTFELAARPAVLAVDPGEALDASASFDPLAPVEEFVSVAEWAPKEPPAALPEAGRVRSAAPGIAPGIAPGPDSSRLVARWVTGDAGWRLPEIEPAGLIPRLTLRPGPLVQLVALIPLCLVLLGRQRRFHHRVVALALPPHVAASRALIASR